MEAGDADLAAVGGTETSAVLSATTSSPTETGDDAGGGDGAVEDAVSWDTDPVIDGWLAVVVDAVLGGASAA
jgi:hypothetical protein